MNTMQLHCFLAVAETLNFTQAAERLNLSQPAVTQQIHTLEDELGVRLFKRTTRTVELTPEGDIFWNDARTIADMIRHARSRFSEPENSERIPLMIGCENPKELDLLACFLEKLHQEIPGLYPVFKVLPRQHLFPLLKEETLDVLFGFQDDGMKKTRFCYRELARIQPVAILSRSHPFFDRSSLSAADLKSEKLIVLNSRKIPDGFQSIQKTILKDRPMAKLHFQDSFEECLLMAKAGFGLAILPDLFVEKDPDLCYIPLSDFKPMSYGIWFQKPVHKTALKQLIGLSRQSFEPLT